MTATAAPPTVTWDREASTQFVAVYRAQSRRHAHVTYKLKLEHRTGALTCECPAYTFRARCAHTRAVRALWWRNFWESCADDVLADAQRSYGLQADEGSLTAEGEIALDTLNAELAQRDRGAA